MINKYFVSCLLLVKMVSICTAQSVEIKQVELSEVEVDIVVPKKEKVEDSEVEVDIVASKKEKVESKNISNYIFVPILAMSAIFGYWFGLLTGYTFCGFLGACLFVWLVMELLFVYDDVKEELNRENYSTCLTEKVEDKLIEIEGMKKMKKSKKMKRMEWIEKMKSER